MKETKHPYKEYEQTMLWELIDKAIDDLVKNQDVELTTRKEYIVGYLCKTIQSDLKDLSLISIAQNDTSSNIYENGSLKSRRTLNKKNTTLERKPKSKR